MWKHYLATGAFNKLVADEKLLLCTSLRELQACNLAIGLNPVYQIQSVIFYSKIKEYNLATSLANLSWLPLSDLEKINESSFTCVTGNLLLVIKSDLLIFFK